MTLAAFDPATGAVLPPLDADESLVCTTCGTVVPAAAADDDVGQTVRETGAPICLGCERPCEFERLRLPDAKRSVAQRWGSEVAAAGWTPVPSLLLRHTKALGLKRADLTLIVALEDYRWTQDDPVVYPARDKLASAVGCGLSALDESVKRLECAGLIEVHTRHRARGWQTTNGYTRDGLTLALARLADNRIAGRSETDGLTDVLSTLRGEGKRRRQLRLQAGHAETEGHEAEQRKTENNQLPSLRDEASLVQGSRNPRGQERRAG
jgi:hypothetical protein